MKKILGIVVLGFFFCSISFADAVSAYNAAHGTSYTEAQAKEALGQ